MLITITATEKLGQASRKKIQKNSRNNSRAALDDSDPGRWRDGPARESGAWAKEPGLAI